MINKKTIIILSAVLVVMIGAFLAVNYLWTEQPQKNTPDEFKSIEIWSGDKENVTKIDLTVDKDSFSFIRTGGGWSLNGTDVKLKNSQVEYLAAELTSVHGKECIEENATDLSKYGLSEPFGTYKVSFKDNTTKTFYLGDEDPVTNCYYFKMDDSPKVYTIYSTKGDTLLKGADSYRDDQILKIDTENITSISVKTSTQIFELQLTTEGEGEEATTVWNMIRPLTRECDTQIINDEIISKISYMSVEAFIDADDEGYSSSGVNNPVATVTVADYMGGKQTIYVGNEKGGSRYIKTDGEVYLINGDSVSFINVDPFIYISKFINLENIDDVKRVDVTHNGKTHTATIEGEKDKYTYKLDGKEVLEDKFKKEVYQKVIGLFADGFAKTPVYRSPEYTVTFYLKDGSVKKTDFCYYDSRSYAAFKDGRCEFIIRQKELENMFASIENVIK